MAKILLQDAEFLTYKIEERSAPSLDGSITVRGKFQHCGIQNKNGRVYPVRVWEKALNQNSDFKRAMRENRVFGHLEHPADGRSDLNKAAIRLVDVTLESDGRVTGEIKTLGTPAGKIAAALFRDNMTVGISSRGHGSVMKNNEGLDEVQDDFTPETFDLVADPSTPGAHLVSEALTKGYGSASYAALTEEAKKRLHSDTMLVEIEEQLCGLERCKKLNEHNDHALADLNYTIRNNLAESPAKIVLPMLERIAKLKAHSAQTFACKHPGCVAEGSFGTWDHDFHLAQLVDVVLFECIEDLKPIVTERVEKNFRHLSSDERQHIIAYAVAKIPTALTSSSKG
jgi:hypothetical protein